MKNVVLSQSIFIYVSNASRFYLRVTTTPEILHNSAQFSAISGNSRTIPRNGISI